MSFIYVAIGGFFGSLLRFYLSLKLNKRLIGTWIANVTGAMLLAAFVYLHTENKLAANLWLILGVGFCGSYTTFSTFGNEVLNLLLNQQYKKAILYVLSSLIVSFLIVMAILLLLGYEF